VLGCVSCSVPASNSDTLIGFAPRAILDGPAATDKSDAGTRQNAPAKSHQVRANTYQLNLGPQVVRVRAAYRDNAEANLLQNDPGPANLERYFDLRATSALSGTNLLGEGEMAYNLQDSLDGNVRPAMLRLGLKHHWGGLTYGADYKSVQRGFSSLAGSIAEQSRDETLFWSEHRSGPWKLRASIGEAWEQISDTGDLLFTRTTATVLHLNKPRWGGSLSTSYALAGQGTVIDDYSVLIGKLTTSFRPSGFLLIEPNFSLKEEWSQGSAGKSQTPASGFSFTYSPMQSRFRLTGGTSFSRKFASEASGDVTTHAASASLDWRLGNFIGRNDSLSFSFNYNRQLVYSLPGQSNYSVSSLVKFKIAGF
jgi:hypothetical protein